MQDNNKLIRDALLFARLRDVNYNIRLTAKEYGELFTLKSAIAATETNEINRATKQIVEAKIKQLHLHVLIKEISELEFDKALEELAKYNEFRF